MQPFFLPARHGQRFCLFHPAAGAGSRGAVLYLHPFAEEMNKSRRMAALQSRALAAAGYDVLQIDLLGCGDSSGVFGDASWQGWLEDVEVGYRDLRERSTAPLILWGLRAGCLLAAEAATELPEPADFIFWQPVVSGMQHWQQFMRLKLAGALLGGSKEGSSDLKNGPSSDSFLEVAGYSISGQLARAIKYAELRPPPRPSRVSWLEISSRQESEMSPVSQKFLQQWVAAGFEVDALVLRGPAFWQTADVEEVPDLLDATLRLVSGNT